MTILSVKSTGLSINQLYVRLVALTFLFAFADTFLQFETLVGRDGIAPINKFFECIYAHLKSDSYLLFPSLFWLNNSTQFISVVIIIGSITSFLALSGIYCSLNLIVCCVCWLSIINSGGDFFIYIWDTMLIEAGLIATVVARIQKQTKLNQLNNFLPNLFIFRLWFSMGMVLIYDNKSVTLSAEFIQLFLQNQPMPTHLSYFLYHLPSVFKSFASFALFFVEIIIPFFIFIPRLKPIAFFAFLFFSILIQLSGNFAWFNLLTIFCSLPILNNTLLGTRIETFLSKIALNTYQIKVPYFDKLFSFFVYYQSILQLILLSLLFFPIGNRYLNFLNYYTHSVEFNKIERKHPFFQILSIPLKLGSAFKIANPYGVFKGISVKRWELEFELLNDTLSKKNYPVKYFFKPGFDEKYSFFAPHIPRLEQQLFYEAQHGSFFKHYTLFNSIFDNNCWTNGYIKFILNQSNCDKTTNDRKFNKWIRINLIELNYNSFDKYKKTGSIWNKNKLTSFYVNCSQISCPILPESYYQKFNKHINVKN